MSPGEWDEGYDGKYCLFIRYLLSTLHMTLVVPGNDDECIVCSRKFDN